MVILKDVPDYNALFGVGNIMTPDTRKPVNEGIKYLSSDAGFLASTL